jgi:hypothetical protein
MLPRREALKLSRPFFSNRVVRDSPRPAPAKVRARLGEAGIGVTVFLRSEGGWD